MIEDKGGRPPYEPTDQNRKQVSAMAAYGIPQMDICNVLGISINTLTKYYRHELDTGGAIATAKVAENLYKKATGDGSQSVTAAIFWLKTRAGWKETQTIEHKHDDSSALDRINSRLDSIAAAAAAQEDPKRLN